MKEYIKATLLFPLLFCSFSISIFAKPCLTKNGRSNYDKLFNESPKLEYFKSKTKHKSKDVNIAYLFIKAESPKGTVIVVNGRGEDIEELFIQNGLLKTLVVDNQLNVCLYDHRGQGRSDRLLDDPVKGHVQHFKDYRADLAQLIETLQKQSAQPPFKILGMSMGALVTVDYLLNTKKDDRLIQSVALVAPLLGTKIFEYQDYMNIVLVNMLSVGKKNTDYFPGQSANDAGNKNDKYAKTDLGRYYQHMAEESSVTGGATKRWAAEIARAIHRIRKQAAKAEEPCISVPLLVLMADDDRQVSNRKARKTLFDTLLFGDEPKRLHTFPGAPHALLFWDNALNENVAAEERQKAANTVSEANQKLADFFVNQLL